MGASQGPVLSNTTPIINLVGVRLLDLLPALYGAVLIPDLVRDEYEMIRQGRRISARLRAQVLRAAHETTTP